VDEFHYKTGKVKVIHFHRKPQGAQISIERLFAQVRSALPSGVECAIHENPFSSKGVLARIRNILAARKHQGEVNHITGDVHYLALGLRKSRTLLTIHDCASLERLGGLRRLVFKWLWFTLPIRCSQLITVISESTRRELLRHVRCNPNKIRVVHNCVDPSFLPSPKSFDSEDPEILQLGTASNKNLERLAQSVTGLHCRLNIIGSLNPTQEAVLRKLGIRYSNTPRATDEELLSAFQNCDMVAFVSTYEGFGLPIIEANAVGRPVITSNLLSMPEVAGNAACLVNPLDVESIRTGILKMWHDADYREDLIQAGFENVKRFSATTIAAQYAALYTELLAEKKG
jgi:glycosyltransferase involved in cell wall biosynthesis